MTNEEKARAYDEALERAKKQRADYQKELDKTDKNSQLAGLLRAGISAIDMAFPELAESEDERIRKVIVKYFKELHVESWINLEIPNILAWLEKQKEQKLSATINGETIPTENYSVDIPLAEWSDEDEIRLTNTLIMLKEYAIHHYSKDDVEKSVDWLENRVKFLRPQPKPAWSDEDETAFGDLMWCIKQAVKSAKDENDMGNVWFAENWVKNRLKFLRPQPKQEWSEEDEDTINLMIAILRENYSNCLFKTNSANTTRMSAISTDMLIKRIEALYPQPKAEWSEEDEAHRNFILESLENQIRFCKKDAKGAHYAKQICTAQNWLKSLKSHWKPNEEQMEALKDAVRLFKETHFEKFHYKIESLYEQLKKL